MADRNPAKPVIGFVRNTLLSAERQFHRLNGYRQLAQLSASLAKLTGADESELAAAG